METPLSSRFGAVLPPFSVLSLLRQSRVYTMWEIRRVEVSLSPLSSLCMEGMPAGRVEGNFARFPLTGRNSVSVTFRCRLEYDHEG